MVQQGIQLIVQLRVDNLLRISEAYCLSLIPSFPDVAGWNVGPTKRRSKKCHCHLQVCRYPSHCGNRRQQGKFSPGHAFWWCSSRLSHWNQQFFRLSVECSELSEWGSWRACGLKLLGSCRPQQSRFAGALEFSILWMTWQGNLTLLLNSRICLPCSKRWQSEN